jgi:hypothetical protein
MNASDIFMGVLLGGWIAFSLAAIAIGIKYMIEDSK